MKRLFLYFLFLPWQSKRAKKDHSSQGPSTVTLVSIVAYFLRIIPLNKKVLLRERKRHTARHVSSTLSTVLFQGGYHIPGQGGTLGWGTSHPDLTGGTPSLAREYPILGYLPILTWGYLIPGHPGVPPSSTVAPLGRDLGPVTGIPPLERTWDQWKHYGVEMGYPQKGHGISGSIMEWRWSTPPSPRVWTDKQTETVTFPILWMRAVITQNDSSVTIIRYRWCVGPIFIWFHWNTEICN